jgi:hypothetical protein
MSRPTPVVGLLLASMLLAACGASSTTPSVSETASSSAPESQTASASPASVGLGATDTDVVPGTYIPLFQPAFTLTIGDVVTLDCIPGARCRGSIDSNEVGWLDIEFGTDHGAEIDVIRLGNVIDPAAPGTLIAAPDDLSAWVAALLGPPEAVMVGGVPATRFDVQTAGELQFGMISGTQDGEAGIGPSGLRVIVLRVDDVAVLITEWLGPSNSVRDGQGALDSLQPLVDSIHWN